MPNSIMSAPAAGRASKDGLAGCKIRVTGHDEGAENRTAFGGAFGETCGDTGGHQSINPR